MKKNNKKKFLICVNKKSYFNYFIKKKFTAGIVLKGWEIKSIRKKMIDLTNSYLIIKDFEIFLLNCVITPVKTVSLEKSKFSVRKKKILLHKKEILFINRNIQKKKYTLIPISMFWKKSWCKLKIALSKGKKSIDKREIKKYNIIKKDLQRFSKSIFLKK